MGKISIHNTITWILSLIVCFSIEGAGNSPLYFLSQELPLNPTVVLKRMFDEVSKIQDYKCMFIKTEIIKNRLKTETIKYLFKKPKKIRMEWIKPKKRIKAIFDGKKMKVRIFFFTFKLNHRSKLAHKGSNHYIDESDLSYIVGRIKNNVEEVGVKAKLKVRETIGAKQLYNIELTYHQYEKEQSYCYKALLWIDSKLYLPYKIEFYDFHNHLFERFIFKDLKVNIGISDKEFEF